MEEKDLFSAVESKEPKALLLIKNLRPIHNLKSVFREMRDYLAGNATGITRDEKIAENIMRLIFCKIYDERSKKPSDPTDCANRPGEKPHELSDRIRALFNQVKNSYPGIFDQKEAIDLGAGDLSYLVSLIELYTLYDADRDAVADAFEELIGTSFRGGEGQFFTPRNVVQMMIDVLEPAPQEKILDPACGSGGFLSYTLRYMLHHGNSDFLLVGIEKDAFLAKIARAYLALIGKGEYFVLCENSLEVPGKWSIESQKVLELNSFDLILTNPPFGAKIPVVGRDLLLQYQLGNKWVRKSDEWSRTSQLLSKQPPQVLFLERCMQFLKPNGRLGIVLPEGLFGNPSDRYIWEYISTEASITGIVSLAQETFQPSTHTKTSVLFLKKTLKRPKSIFMGIANSVGHNKNGREIYKIYNDGGLVLDHSGNKILDDDLPRIAKAFKRPFNAAGRQESHLGFRVDSTAIQDNILIPEYYNPEIQEQLACLVDSGQYQLIDMNSLLKRRIIEIRRGNEIGSQFYGTGDIPFVRTSDIVNWEIKLDPIKGISEAAYEKFKKMQDIQENDILFVSDGTFLIGRCAIVTPLDLRIVIQSHIRKIRVLDKEFVDPYYLFYLLNSNIVRRQIDAKTFVQATISTIGSRIGELVLPMLTDKVRRQHIAEDIKSIIGAKAGLRERSLSILENSP